MVQATHLSASSLLETRQMSQVQPLAANFAKLSFFANAEMKSIYLQSVVLVDSQIPQHQDKNLLLSCIYYQKTKRKTNCSKPA